MPQLLRIDPAVDKLPLTFRVNQAIRSNPLLAGASIMFSAHSGLVTLRGTSQTYYQKQMAQESLSKLDGVEAIENQIEVVRDAR
jgi:osmotically-inducible protein OsmY